MTRREFLNFFLIGGFFSLFFNKIKTLGKSKLKEAMFWRKSDES